MVRVALGSNTHVVITGGSSGIGLATAEALAHSGARVSLVARRSDRLNAAAQTLRCAGARVVTAVADVGDEDAVNQAFEFLVAEQGECDVLVTSAGISHPGHFGDLTSDMYRESLNTNYFGTLWPIRAVVPRMVERGSGSIMGIASLVGMFGIFGYTALSPAKFAVRGLLESLRDELRPRGVHVGYVCPPDVDTPYYANEQPLLPDEYKEFAAAMAVVAPGDVAREIVRAIERSKPRVVMGATNRAAVATFALTPGLLRWHVDRSVRRVRRR